MDAFFISMAVAIMFGLTFATILTLIVVPLFYIIFYNLPYQSERGSSGNTKNDDSPPGTEVASV